MRSSNAQMRVVAVLVLLHLLFLLPNGVQAQCTAFNVGGGGASCLSATGPSITLNGSTIGINYQLVNGTANVGAAKSGTGSALTWTNNTSAGIYTIVATKTTTPTCSATMSGSVTVTINPLPTLFTVGGGGSMCSGATGLTLTLSGSQSGMNYQLKRGTVLVGTALAGTGTSLSWTNNNTAGTYTITATDATTTCTRVMTGNAVITVNPLPTAFTVGGTGGFCTGDATGRTITLSGSQSGVNYQLRNGSTDAGAALSGTGSSLSWPTITTAGSYTVIATNTTTSCTKTMTGTATITEVPLPTVFTIGGGGTSCSGATGPSITLSSSTTGINYQLVNGTTNTGAAKAGTGSVLTWANNGTAGTYAIIATKATAPTCSATMTGNAMVTINPLPTLFTVGGGGSFCSGGAGLSITLTGSQSGINYQLKRGTVLVGTPIAGTGSSLSWTNNATAGTYTVTATDATTTCARIMTGNAIVTVSPLPTVFTVGGTGGFCAGDATGRTITLSGSQSGVNYQLRNGSTDAGAALSGTGSSLSWPTITTAGSYTVIATNTTTSCTKTMTGTATITEVPLPTVFTIGGGGTSCSGATGPSITLSSSTTGINYQLVNGTTNTGAAKAGTGSVLTWANNGTAGTYAIIATKATAPTCSATMTGNAMVTINPLPTLFTVGGGGSFCSGGAGLSITLTGSQSGINYQLKRGTVLVGTPIAGTGSSLSWTNNATAGTYTVTATDATTTCARIMTGNAIVTVSPLPTVFTVGGTGGFCAGDATGRTITLSGSQSGVNYQLRNGSTDAGTVLSGTGSSLSWPGIITAGAYTIIATNTTTTCAKTMTGTATITQNPLPTLFTVTGGNVCSPATVTVGLSGSQSGTNYQLKVNGINQGAAKSGTGAALNLGTQATVGIYTIVATNATSGCTQVMTNSAVINSIPSAFTISGGGEAVCSGNGPSIILSGSQTGVNYQLNINGTATGSAINGTGNTLSWTNQNFIGTYTVLAIDASLSSCTKLMAGNAAVTPSTFPALFTVGGGGNAVGGNGIAVTLSGSQTGVNYQLLIDGAATGTPLSGTGTALNWYNQASKGVYTVNAVNATTSCAQIMTGSATVKTSYQVQWKDLTGVTNNAGILTKTVPVGWGNGGANSSNVLLANQDGWIEFEIGNLSSTYIVGLATNSDSFDPSSILYGIYIDKNGLFYLGGGSNPYVASGSWAAGDVFRLALIGGQVKYYRNGVELKSVSTSPNTDLRVKSEIYTGENPLVYSSFDSKIFLTSLITPVLVNGTGGGIQVVASEGTPPYSYQWSSGETTAGIQGKSLGKYTVTVTDAETRMVTRDYDLGYRIQWKDLTGVTSNAGILTKTVPVGWGNGGANSSNILLANQDGWIEFEIGNLSSTYVVGFATNSNSFDPSSILHGLYIDKNGLFYLGGGSNPYVASGSWAAGDVFRLALIGDQVKYYRNGVELKSVSISPNTDLRVKSEIYTGENPLVYSSFDSKIFLTSLITPVLVNGTGGGIQVVVSEGTPPYSYQWSSGETTAGIQGKSLGKYTVTVTDAETRMVTRDYDLGYRIQWKDLTGVTNNAGILTKTVPVGWGNGGANSSNILLANQNGWVEFEIGNLSSTYVVGFATNNDSFDPSSILHGLYIDKNGLFYLGGGSNPYVVSGSWAAGDVFRLALIGDQVKYYRNGIELKSVSVDANIDVKVKAALYTGSSPAIYASFDSPHSPLIILGTVSPTSGNTHGGSIQIAVSGGTTPYVYSWSSGETTSSISNKSVATYTVTVTDADGYNVTRSYSVGYAVSWKYTLGVTNTAGVLRKTTATGWDNAGANSSNVLSANTDGWVEFTIDSTNSIYLIGFSVAAGVFNQTAMLGSLYPYNDGKLYWWESNTYTLLGTYEIGDVLRVAREGNQLKGYKNGIEVKSTTVDANQDLKVKSIIYLTNTSSPAVRSSFDSQLAILGTVSPVLNGTDGSIQTTVSGGIGSYTYLWSSGETTSSISNKAVGSYSLTVTDADGHSVTRSYSVGYAVQWKYTLGVTNTAGVLRKTTATGWDNAGANSSNVLSANTDGWVEFTIDSTNSIYLIGFSVAAGVFNQTAMLGSLYPYNDGKLYWWESNTYTLLGTYEIGDVLRVAREGNQLKGYKNGIEVKSTTVDANQDLKVKSIIYLTNTSSPAIRSSFNSPHSPIIILGTVSPASDNAHGGSIQIAVSGGTAPYAYAWSSGETTSSISNKSVGTYSVTVTDADGYSVTRSYSVGYSVQWKDLTGVSNSAGVLTKTNPEAWGDGAISTNQLLANTDGWLEFQPVEGNNHYMAGFTENTIDFSSSGVQYGFYLHSNTEGRSLFRVPGLVSIGTWQSGDILHLSREGNQITYSINGSVIWTETVSPANVLRVKSSIYRGSSPKVMASFTNVLTVLATITPAENKFGGIQLVPTDGTPPYSYLWSSGETTSSISNKSVATYTATVTDADGYSVTRSYSVGYAVQWKDLTGVSNSAGVLTKTAPDNWGNAGANSSNILQPHQDGWLETVINGDAGNFAIGFAHPGDLTPTNLSLILDGFEIDRRSTTGSSIYSSLYSLKPPGVEQRISSLQTGDVLRLERLGDTIRFYLNGIKLRSVVTDASQPLMIKSVQYTGIQNVVNASFNNDAPITNIDAPIADVTPADAAGKGGSIQLHSITGGVPPYTYRWSSGETTPAIFNKVIGEYSVSITDSESRTISKSYHIGHHVFWKDMVGLSIDQEVLTKTAPDNWGDAGANSSNILQAHQDGWLETVINDVRGTFALGFARISDINIASYGLIVEGIEVDRRQNRNSLYSLKSGAEQLIAPLGTGDVLRLERSGDTIRFYLNGIKLRSVATDASQPLMIKSVLYSGTQNVVNASFDFNIDAPVADVTPANAAGKGGSLQLHSITGGVPPYTYHWSSGETTASIVNKPFGQYTLTVTDSEGRQVSRSYGVGHHVFWKDMVGLSIDQDVLTKTAPDNWGNAGANSSNVLQPHQDGWLETVINGYAGDIAIGFAQPGDLTPTNLSLILRGFEIDRRSTTPTGSSIYSSLYFLRPPSVEQRISSLKTGDVLRMERLGDTIRFYQNGIKLRSVATDASQPLMIKSVQYTGIQNVVNTSILSPDDTTNYTPPPVKDTLSIVKIPTQLKIGRDGKSITRPIERQFLLSSLKQGDEMDVFQAPHCLDGEHNIAFQLYYDLGDKQTTKNWTAYLDLTLLHNEDTIWTKPLYVNMTKQTFISTVFNDGLMACADNYRFAIKHKIVTGAPPQDNIYLKILFFKNIIDVFDPDSAVSLTCNYVPGQTTLSWTAEGKNIKEYDIEWVYIENHENFTGTTPQDAFKFKEPVRVTTASQYYTHLTYYPTGSLWYRIRAVGVNPQYPDHRILGQWFYSPCNRITINNHQPDMNWQEQTVFAEEGKYKKVMNYFDGSLRQRQAQTNLSTEQITLVGESLYDYEGRKSVDVLGVPATDAKLTFKSGFNNFVATDPSVIANTSDVKKKFHYDNRRLTNSLVTNQSGAGKYYSPSNDQSTIHKDYIPDAEGYVYSQSEFLNDGTGRLSRQSGVGKEFNMESAHVSRYYYGNAASEELIRLFGSNVGNASHYKKNLVVDPNGQVSVSYLDQEGRVIATSLAGEKPANVAALESYTNLDLTPITIRIDDKNKFDDGISVASHKLMNTSPNSIYSFRYNLAALASSIDQIGCESCSYDLKITLTDPDGKLLNLASASGNQSNDGLSYMLNNMTAASCTNATQVNVQFDVQLQEIGDYTVTKSLIPHELTFEQMVQAVQNDSTINAKIDAIKNSYVIDPADCEICTASCPEADSLINQTIDDIALLDCDNIYQQIVSSFQEQHADEAEVYEPSDSLIATHPLNCQYLLCGKNRASDVFEKQMARLADWDVATAAGYTSVTNLLNTLDPFFYDPLLSGNGFKGSMQSKLQNVNVATIVGRPYGGTINAVTDPANTNFYIDADGNSDPVNGVHILYMDLMNKKSKMSPAAYDKQLKAQHWVLFKSFYMEAKRKTKLEIGEYTSCAAAKKELDRNDDLAEIDRPAEIEAWGDANGGNDPVSDIEVSTSFASIKNTCKPAISKADSTTISNHLKAYFNSDNKNILRLIIRQQLTTNSDLVAIKNILTGYGCGLDSVAMDDPMSCAKNTTIVITHKIESGRSGQQLPDNLTPPSEPLNIGSANRIQTNQTSQNSTPLEEKEILQDSIKSLVSQSSDVSDNQTTSQPQARVVSSLSTTPLPSQAEYDALIDLYNATLGQYWNDNTNWNHIHGPVQSVENWYGIKVDPDTGFVIEIDLSGNNLRGSLPNSIGNLIHLQLFRLSKLEDTDGRVTYNAISGSIPTSIQNLQDLTTLDLGNAQGLSGNIPNEISLLTNLVTLDLSHNRLSGPIPSTIFTNLHNLELLDVSNNDNGIGIAGPFPSSLTGCTKLKYLNLDHCLFTGTMPASIGLLTDLEYLYINSWGDQFSSNIPSELNLLTKLKIIELTGHQLSGTIPDLSALLQLQTLDLSSNNLTGSIPSLDNLDNLRYLYLSNNQLSGPLPASIGGLDQLSLLDLSFNKLTGPIPQSIGDLNNLATMDLSNNQFYGSFPESFTDAASSIYRMTLDFNKFTFTDIIPLLSYHWRDCGGDDGSRPCFTYTPQDSVDVNKVISVIPGQPLNLSAAVDLNTNPACDFQWFKYVDGNNDILLSPSGPTYTVSNFSSSNIGKYYYTINSDAASDLTLISRLQTVKVGTPTDSATTYNICLQYDSTNSTIQKWNFTVNWNDVVARCMANALKEDSILIDLAIEKLLEAQASEYNNTYRTKCLEGASEQMSYAYVPKEYHYTLYYFDQAGNLVQTVPPKGVHPLTHAQVTAFLTGIKTDPAHELITRYQFSSLNQVLYQKTPDAGESRFWYNDKSQLKLSQNAQQFIDKNYSYSRYDEQGRIIEVGEMNSSSDVTTLSAQLQNAQFPMPGDYALSDITRTHYDFPKLSIQQQFKQEFLRTRVAYVEVFQKGYTDTLATYYSYDVHGNVRSLIQQIPGLKSKRTDYVYDLISGKVNYVMYQYGETDQFIHRYDYDADNRIRDVYSSTDGFIWDKEATYFYYMHGPLARVELGQYRVQGLDYYYSLQGWIKGVNMPYAADPGMDGYNGSVVGRDAFAYTLGYYQGDYKPINNAITLSDTRDQLWARYTENMNNTGLFNGNISWMTTDLKKIGQQKAARAKGMQAMVYQYDQLHRIVQSKSLTQYVPGTGYAARTGASAYDENYSYDPNGNILTLQRNDDKAALMDDFNYKYYAATNRLREVKSILRDTVISTGEVKASSKVYRNVTLTGNTYVPAGSNVEVKAFENITADPDFEARDGSDFWAHIVDGPYQYDAIGNLINDLDKGVQITWTPYGKVREVHTKEDSVVVSYKYDATGNRVEKKVVRKTSSGGESRSEVTRYIHDAGGSVMAIYKDTVMTEQPLYGSSRMGMYRGGRKAGERTLGERNYELNNHLGNVLAIMTDNVKMTPDSAWTNVVSANDYYPFGLAMNGRTYVDTTYWNGSQNGKKKCQTCGVLKTKLDQYISQYGEAGLSNDNQLVTYLNNALAMVRSIKEYKEALYECKLTDAYLNFRGNAYVNFGKAPQYTIGTSDFTVEAWSRFPAADNQGLYPIVTDEHYFSNGTFSGFTLAIWQGQIVFWVMDGSGYVQVQTQSLPSSDTWHHIVVQRVGNQGSNFKMFIDGALVPLTVVQQTLTDGDIDIDGVEPLKIGSRIGSYDNASYKGDIKQVRIYKRLLTAAEIQASYGNGCSQAPTNTSALLLWAPLDDGVGNTVADNSSYSQTGNWIGTNMNWNTPSQTGSCTNSTQTTLCTSGSANTDGQISYRYGFNGKEKDSFGDQVYDYGFRIYNPRIARFLSDDPLTKKYPELTPYQFASNRPIDGVDLDGLEYGSPPFQQIEFIYELTQPKEKQRSTQQILHQADANQQAWSKGIVVGAAVSATAVGGRWLLGNWHHVLYNPIVQNEIAAGAYGLVADDEWPVPAVSDNGTRAFRYAGDGVLETARGLKYGFRQYGRGPTIPENALTHVFKHTLNDLDKDFHGVFDQTGSGLVKQLDDVWGEIQKVKWDANKTTETVGSITRTVRKDGYVNYLVETGGRVGYEGGKLGSGKDLTKILVSTDGNTSDVVTAFPK